MVLSSGRDLSCRYLRLENDLRERRRREKRNSPTLHRDLYLAAEQAGQTFARRVLFEDFRPNTPDSPNLNSWIAGQLAEVADQSKRKWNFDFKAGVPAKIPGHQLEWEKTGEKDENDAPPEGTASAPAADVSSCEELATDGKSDVSTFKSSKIVCTVKRDKRQARISEFWKPTKYAKTSINKEKRTPADL